MHSTTTSLYITCAVPQIDLQYMHDDDGLWWGDWARSNNRELVGRRTEILLSLTCIPMMGGNRSTILCLSFVLFHRAAETTFPWTTNWIWSNSDVDIAGNFSLHVYYRYYTAVRRDDDSRASSCGSPRNPSRGSIGLYSIHFALGHKRKNSLGNGNKSSDPTVIELPRTWRWWRDSPLSPSTILSCPHLMRTIQSVSGVWTRRIHGRPFSFDSLSQTLLPSSLSKLNYSTKFGDLKM